MGPETWLARGFSGDATSNLADENDRREIRLVTDIYAVKTLR